MKSRQYIPWWAFLAILFVGYLSSEFPRINPSIIWFLSGLFLGALSVQFIYDEYLDGTEITDSEYDQARHYIRTLRGLSETSKAPVRNQ